MIHVGYGLYESAQMGPVGKAGSVEETGNTVVDVMGIRDEMIMKGGGDDGDGMGNAGGELDVAEKEMGLQVLQGNSALVQVYAVPDRAVPSSHGVRAENEMQEQSLGEGNPNRGFSDVNTGALITDDDVMPMEEVENDSITE